MNAFHEIGFPGLLELRKRAFTNHRAGHRKFKSGLGSGFWDYDGAIFFRKLMFGNHDPGAERCVLIGVFLVSYDFAIHFPFFAAYLGSVLG